MSLASRFCQCLGLMPEAANELAMSVQHNMLANAGVLLLLPWC